jgi:hypothetical protein
MKMDTPVIALTAKPHISTGKTFLSDCNEPRGPLVEAVDRNGQKLVSIWHDLKLDD